MTISTIDQIRLDYPNEWVLIANPNLGEEGTLGTIIKKLISGIVLFHSQDKHEVAYKGKEAREGYDNVTLIYTGEIPKKRKFWL